MSNPGAYRGGRGYGGYGGVRFGGPGYNSHMYNHRDPDARNFGAAQWRAPPPPSAFGAPPQYSFRHPVRHHKGVPPPRRNPRFPSVRYPHHGMRFAGAPPPPQPPKEPLPGSEEERLRTISATADKLKRTLSSITDEEKDHFWDDDMSFMEENNQDEGKGETKDNEKSQEKNELEKNDEKAQELQQQHLQSIIQDNNVEQVKDNDANQNSGQTFYSAVNYDNFTSSKSKKSKKKKRKKKGDEAPDVLENENILENIHPAFRDSDGSTEQNHCLYINNTNPVAQNEDNPVIVKLEFQDTGNVSDIPTNIPPLKDDSSELLKYSNSQSKEKDEQVEQCFNSVNLPPMPLENCKAPDKTTKPESPPKMHSSSDIEPPTEFGALEPPPEFTFSETHFELFSESVIPLKNPELPPNPKLPPSQHHSQPLTLQNSAPLQPPPVFDPRIPASERNLLVPMLQPNYPVAPIPVAPSTTSGFLTTMAYPPPMGCRPPVPAVQPFLPNTVCLPPMQPPLPQMSIELPKEMISNPQELEEGLEDMQEAFAFAKQLMDMSDTSLPLLKKKKKKKKKSNAKDEDTDGSENKVLYSTVEPRPLQMPLPADNVAATQSSEKISLPSTISATKNSSKKDEVSSKPTELDADGVDRPKVVFNLAKTKKISKQEDWQNQEEEEKKKPTFKEKEVEKLSKKKTSLHEKLSDHMQEHPKFAESPKKRSSESLLENKVCRSNGNNVYTNSSYRKSKRKSVTESGDEATWKDKVINRFLKMSKNEICNMINNSSLRKFDIPMRQLMREKRTSMSLEMRNTEEDKTKNHDDISEEFVSQLSAMLDPSATVDIGNLPTAFIYHLNEFMQLGMEDLPPLEANGEPEMEPERILEAEVKSTKKNRKLAKLEAKIELEKQREQELMKEEADIHRQKQTDVDRIKEFERSTQFSSSHKVASLMTGQRKERNVTNFRNEEIADIFKFENIVNFINEPSSSQGGALEHQVPEKMVAHAIDDIFSAGLLKNRSQQKCISPNFARSSVSMTNHLPVPAVKDPVIETFEKTAVDTAVDNIFSAGIAKVLSKNSTLDNRQRNYKTYNPPKQSEEIVPDWSNRPVRKEREDVDNYRNLTKEEWEARLTRPTNDGNDRLEKPRQPAKPTSPLPAIVNPVENRNPSTEESESEASDTGDEDDGASSSSSSDSSSEKSVTTKDVTQLLKVIKEREKIAKKRSLNETIRDEVAAEIARKWKEQEKHKKSRKKNKKKDRKGKKRKVRKRHKRRNHSSSGTDDEANEDAEEVDEQEEGQTNEQLENVAKSRILSEEEIKKEIKEEPEESIILKNTVNLAETSSSKLTTTVQKTDKPGLNQSPLKTKAQLKLMPENSSRMLAINPEKPEVTKKLTPESNPTSSATKSIGRPVLTKAQLKTIEPVKIEFSSMKKSPIQVTENTLNTNEKISLEKAESVPVIPLKLNSMPVFNESGKRKLDVNEYKARLQQRKAMEENRNLEQNKKMNRMIENPSLLTTNLLNIPLMKRAELKNEVPAETSNNENVVKTKISIKEPVVYLNRLNINDIKSPDRSNKINDVAKIKTPSTSCNQVVQKNNLVNNGNVESKEVNRDKLSADKTVTAKMQEREKKNEKPAISCNVEKNWNKLSADKTVTGKMQEREKKNEKPAISCNVEKKVNVPVKNNNLEESKTNSNVINNEQSPVSVSRDPRIRNQEEQAERKLVDDLKTEREKVKVLKNIEKMKEAESRKDETVIVTTQNQKTVKKEAVDSKKNGKESPQEPKKFDKENVLQAKKVEEESALQSKKLIKTKNPEIKKAEAKSVVESTKKQEKETKKLAKEKLVNENIVEQKKVKEVVESVVEKLEEIQKKAEKEAEEAIQSKEAETNKIVTTEEPKKSEPVRRKLIRRKFNLNSPEQRTSKRKLSAASITELEASEVEKSESKVPEQDANRNEIVSNVTNDLNENKQNESEEKEIVVETKSSPELQEKETKEKEIEKEIEKQQSDDAVLVDQLDKPEETSAKESLTEVMIENGCETFLSEQKSESRSASTSDALPDTVPNEGMTMEMDTPLFNEIARISTTTPVNDCPLLLIPSDVPYEEQMDLSEGCKDLEMDNLNQIVLTQVLNDDETLRRDTSEIVYNDTINCNSLRLSSPKNDLKDDEELEASSPRSSGSPFKGFSSESIGLQYLQKPLFNLDLDEIDNTYSEGLDPTEPISEPINDLVENINTENDILPLHRVCDEAMISIPNIETTPLLEGSDSHFGDDTIVKKSEMRNLFEEQTIPRNLLEDEELLGSNLEDRDASSGETEDKHLNSVHHPSGDLLISPTFPMTNHSNDRIEEEKLNNNNKTEKSELLNKFDCQLNESEQSKGTSKTDERSMDSDNYKGDKSKDKSNYETKSFLSTEAVSMNTNAEAKLLSKGMIEDEEKDENDLEVFRINEERIMKAEDRVNKENHLSVARSKDSTPIKKVNDENEIEKVDEDTYKNIIQQAPYVLLEKSKDIDNLVTVNRVQSKSRSSSSRNEDAKLHKVKKKHKRKKDKKRYSETEIKSAIKEGLVEKVEKVNTRESVMARMIQIDLEIHKLVTEKIALYQLLQGGTLMSESDLKDSRDEGSGSGGRASKEPNFISDDMTPMTDSTFPYPEHPSPSIRGSSKSSKNAHSNRDRKSSTVDEIGVNKHSHKSRRRGDEKREKEKSRGRKSHSRSKERKEEKEKSKIKEESATSESANKSAPIQKIFVIPRSEVDKINSENTSKINVPESKKISTNNEKEKPKKGPAKSLKDLLPDVKKRKKEPKSLKEPAKDESDTAMEEEKKRPHSRMLKSKGHEKSKRKRIIIYSDESSLDVEGTMKNEQRKLTGLNLLEEKFRQESLQQQKLAERLGKKRKIDDSDEEINAEVDDIIERSEKSSLTSTIKKKKRKIKKSPAVVDEIVEKHIDDVINAVAANKSDEITQRKNRVVSPNNDSATASAPESIKHQINKEDNADSLMNEKDFTDDTMLINRNIIRLSETPEDLDNESFVMEKCIDDDSMLQEEDAQKPSCEISETFLSADSRGSGDNAVDFVLDPLQLSSDKTVITTSKSDDQPSPNEEKLELFAQKIFINTDQNKSETRTNSDAVDPLLDDRKPEDDCDKEVAAYDELSERNLKKKTIRSHTTTPVGKSNSKDDKRSKLNTPLFLDDQSATKSRCASAMLSTDSSLSVMIRDENSNSSMSSQSQFMSKHRHSVLLRRSIKSVEEFAAEQRQLQSSRTMTYDEHRQNIRRRMTLEEMMNCKVQIEDSKYTLLAPNVNPLVLRKLGISRINLPSKKPKVKSRPNSATDKPDSTTTSLVSEDSGTVSQNAETTASRVSTPVVASSPLPVRRSNRIQQYNTHKGPILDIKVFEDSFLAASEDGMIYRYSLSSDQVLNVYKGHTNAVTCLCVQQSDPFTDHKREWVYSGSLDGTLRCYDIRTGSQIKSATEVGSPIQCMDASSWNTLYIGTKCGSIGRFKMKIMTLYIMNLDNDRSDQQINSCTLKEEIRFCEKSVLALKATCEGVRKVLIVAVRNQPITIRDAITGLLLRTISGQKQHTVYSLLRNENLIYCGTSSTSIPVFDFITSQEILQFNAGVGIVCMCLYKKLLFAGCYDGKIYVFDLKKRNLVCSLPGPGNMLLSMEVVGNTIIAGSKDMNLHAWDMPDQVLDILETKH